jgi:hypothetical protein
VIHVREPHGPPQGKRIGTDRKAVEQVKRVLNAKLPWDFGILRDEKPSATLAKQWLEQYAEVECKRSTQRG